MVAQIQRQVEYYQQASWQIDHTRAMACRELEDWLDYGLALLEAIRRIDQRLRQHIESGKLPLRSEEIEAVWKLFELWYAPCEHLLGEIEKLEAEGFAVENAPRFREACASSPVPEFDPVKLKAAAEQFAQGRGRPLGQVMDEIRRRVV